MFVAWMTQHMTSKHILLRQQITMRAERQHFHLLVEVVNAGHAVTASGDTQGFVLNHLEVLPVHI